MNLTEIIDKNLPPEVRRRLLFLDTFIEPMDFYTMPAVDRLFLMQRSVSQEVAPTINNKWVWFGPYSHKDQMPIYNNTRVVRSIYELVIGPLHNPLTNKPGRLMNSLVEQICDVNPFKYLPAQGRKYMGPTKYAETAGIDVNQSRTLAAKKILDPQIILGGVNRLYAHLNDFKTEDGWEFLLSTYEIRPDLIPQIIKLFKEKHHDLIESIRSAEGISLPSAPESTIATTPDPKDETSWPTDLA